MYWKGTLPATPASLTALRLHPAVTYSIWRTIEYGPTLIDTFLKTIRNRPIKIWEIWVRLLMKLIRRVSCWCLSEAKNYLIKTTFLYLLCLYFNTLFLNFAPFTSFFPFTSFTSPSTPPGGCFLKFPFKDCGLSYSKKSFPVKQHGYCLFMFYVWIRVYYSFVVPKDITCLYSEWRFFATVLAIKLIGKIPKQLNNIDTCWSGADKEVVGNCCNSQNL